MSDMRDDPFSGALRYPTSQYPDPASPYPATQPYPAVDPYSTPPFGETPPYAAPAAPTTSPGPAPTYPASSPYGETSAPPVMQYQDGATYSGAPAYPGASTYSGGPGFYSPPPKKRHTGLIVSLCAVAVVIVLAALAGGVALIVNGQGGHSAKTVATPSAPVSVTSPTLAPTASDGPLHSGDLRHYLISAPKSSKAFSKPLGSHNSFTAKQEGNTWEDSEQRASQLSLHDFSHGAVRQWLQSNTSVTVELFQFARTVGANAFYTDDEDASDYFDKPAYLKSVTDIPQAAAYYTKKKDSQGDLVTFAIARCGDVVVEVFVYEYKSSPADLAVVLLGKQYQKLCS